MITYKNLFLIHFWTVNTAFAYPMDISHCSFPSHKSLCFIDVWIAVLSKEIKCNLFAPYYNLLEHLLILSVRSSLHRFGLIINVKGRIIYDMLPKADVQNSVWRYSLMIKMFSIEMCIVIRFVKSIILYVYTLSMHILLKTEKMFRYVHEKLICLIGIENS